ncbi:MAG: rhomboid family intramembrane serine protease [Chitinivibrionales bacterium]|nr:rhomboid family intramembrane serine protease [Chitinivibrionales bacterium]
MFPLRDENPTFHTSVATFVLIGINVASWILVQGTGFNPALAKSVCRFGLIPGELLGTLEPGTRVPIGNGLACVLDGSSSWLTIFSSMFMHGGWFHLVGNMWFLSVFGDNVEDVMGPVKFIMFYLLCGTAAAAVQVLSNPSSALPMVGASGAIGGVMGAYAILFPRAPVHMLVFFGFFITRIIVPAFFMLGYWFFLQFIGVFFSFGTGGVAFWAHIGGFVAGIATIKLFCKRHRLEDCRSRRGNTDTLMRRVNRQGN